MTTDPELQQYLAPAEYVDSAATNVTAFAREAAGDATDPRARAVRLYYAVRDEIVYTPYCDFTDVETSGPAPARAAAPGSASARPRSSPRPRGPPAFRRASASRTCATTSAPHGSARLMGTDTFVYHGYTDLYLEGRWVKATPAFDRGLCEKFGVRALEFDGRADSLFQPHDMAGRRHMEYLQDRGARVDVPVAEIMAAFAQHYPALTARPAAPLATQFRQEAEDASGSG